MRRSQTPEKRIKKNVKGQSCNLGGEHRHEEAPCRLAGPGLGRNGRQIVSHLGEGSANERPLFRGSSVRTKAGAVAGKADPNGAEGEDEKEIRLERGCAHLGKKLAQEKKRKKGLRGKKVALSRKRGEKNPRPWLATRGGADKGGPGEGGARKRSFSRGKGGRPLVLKTGKPAANLVGLMREIVKSS